MLDLFDTHTHIQDRGFNADRAAVLARARAAGVRRMVIAGEDEPSSRAGIALARDDAGLWTTVGLHPHKATRADDGFDTRLGELAHAPRVVAIGEIGLDFHYDRSPRPAQADAFKRQLAVAAERGLPVVIHSREARDETLAILTPWAANRRRDGWTEPFGVMHCFGYDRAAVEQFVGLGFMISIPGPVTYPKAEAMQAVARATPEDRLVIETDAPVLAPQGHRGKRNEPAYLVETARAVAALRGVSLDQIAATTSANACRLFRLPDAAPVATGAKRRDA